MVLCHKLARGRGPRTADGRFERNVATGHELPLDCAFRFLQSGRLDGVPRINSPLCCLHFGVQPPDEALGRLRALRDLRIEGRRGLCGDNFLERLPCDTGAATRSRTASTESRCAIRAARSALE